MQYVYTYSELAWKDIEEKIKSILERGNIVCFTNKITGVIKHVTEWNIDKDGDLTASYSTGNSKYVCPFALEYEISEIIKEGGKNEEGK